MLRRLLLVCIEIVLVASLWWLAGRIYGHPPLAVVFALVGASYALAWSVYFVAGRNPLRNKLLNCALSTAAVLVTVGVLELPAGLGLMDYRLLISPQGRTLFTGMKPWDDPRNRFDKELLYTRQPGQHIVGETVGDLTVWLGIPPTRPYPIDARYDSRGFRNDHEIARAPVVVLGDSFLEAGLVAHGALVSTRLGEALNVEVANLGLGGYGPQQELVALQRYGLQMRPQVVIWFFFEGNDLLDVRRYQQFVRDWDATLSERQGFLARSFTKSALTAIAAFASSHTGDRVEARRRSCLLSDGANAGSTTLYLDYEGAPLSAADLATLELAQRDILTARDLVSAQGGRLLFAFVPTKFRVYRDFCEFPADGYGRQWVVNDLPSRLQDWCAAQGIAFVDLTAPLQQAAAGGARVYFNDDGHWNAAGHEVATHAVAGAIRAHGLLAHEAVPDGDAG